MSQLGFMLVEGSDGDLVEARFVILGAPAVAKNSRQIRRGRSGKPFPGRSKTYEAWRNSAVVQLGMQWRLRAAIDTGRKGWLNVAVVSYLAKRQTPDSDNLYCAPLDAMQAAGILHNDYWVRSHDGSDRVPWKEHKSEPRVEITVTRWRR